MISIIVPTYNNLKLFKRAYSSIKLQTVKNVEIIVVDDSSTSEIENFCMNLPVLYYHNKPALGAVKNWNKGLSLAKGEYIMVMHHDEAMMDSSFLEQVWEKLEKGYDVVVSNIEVHRGKNIRRGLCPNWVKRFFLKHSELLLIRNLIGPCACLAFRKDNVIYFDEKLKWTVDKEWYFRLLKNTKFCFLPNNWIGSLHGHAEQITANLNVSAQAKLDYLYMKEKYRANLKVICCLKIMKLLDKIIGFVKAHG